MRRFLRRLLVLGCAMVLATGAGLADGVQFRLTADFDPVQYSDALRPLMEGLAALADAASIEGTWQAENGRFDLDMSLHLPHRDEVHQTNLHIWGLDSHYAIETPLLGDVELMLNNLALAEFGVKAWNHLGAPLQYAALAIPYTHTSAVDALYPTVSVLFPAENGETVLSATELRGIAADLAERCQTDRTLRYWIEAVGIESGADGGIHDALAALPDALATFCPDGLTVTKTDNELVWRPVGENLAALMTLTYEDGTTHLTAMLPELGFIDMNVRDDLTILTGTLHLETPILRGEVAFSLPTALPVTLPFFVTVEAEGMVLGDEAVQLVFEGEARGNTLTIRQLLPDHTRTMATVMLTLTRMETTPLPEWNAEDIAGVNVLSATSETLGALMHEVGRPLVKGVFELVAALPATTCQAMMDVLEDSGILPLLTDAMMGSSEAY